MYRSLGNQGRFKSACHQLTRANFLLVVVLTIGSTALTTYILNTLTSSYKRQDNAEFVMTEAPINDQFSNIIQAPDYSINATEALATLIHNNDLDTASGDLRQVWQEPNQEFSSESRMRPEISQTLESEFSSFKRKLASMSKKDLVTLLKILQERVAKTALLIRKRNAEQQIPSKVSTSPSPSPSANTQPVTEMEGVVIRSAKMNKLMSYLSKIESMMPDLDTKQLDKLSQMNQDKSSLRIVKPGVMDAIMQTNIGDQIRSWKEPIESVAPEPGWPQELEDWPESTTSKPKNKKKKKRKKISTSTTTSPTTTTTAPPTSTSTTTSTTTTPVPSSIPSVPDSPTAAPWSTAPPSTIEEVWIEEEEEIVRPPPKKRRKKYKKKTSPPPVAPVSSTTIAPVSSSTTTTTLAPSSTTTTAPTSSSTSTTTTTAAPETTTTIEDWQEEQPESTTQPGSWPEEHNKEEKWPQEVPKEKWPQENSKEKWPEEEWLDAVRDQVQNQFNIVYV